MTARQRLSILAASVLMLAACTNEETLGSRKAGGDGTSSDPAAACAHVNDLCAGEKGFQKYDCDEAVATHQKLEGAEKEKAEKQLDCVLSKTTCREVRDDCFEVAVVEDSDGGVPDDR